jgi:RNA polymerase sigma-70 factor (ECF subfamily)
MDSETRNLAERRDAAYAAFVQAFALCEPALRGFIRSLVPTRDDMDEVIQQTSVVLWRKYDEFDPGTDFRNWAFTVARFEVLKYRRTRARDRHVFSEELLALLADEGVAEAEQRESERRALEQCIERLAPRQRELIEQCYDGSSTIRQVAESLRRSAGALYKALDRLRSTLLDCIEQSLAREAGYE